MNPVRFGLCGMGGYAKIIGKLLLRMAGADAQNVRLVSVAEPNAARFPAESELLSSRGVAIHASLGEMLKAARSDADRCGLDVVWLPVPIHLHRRFTEQVLGAGFAVMCEKPPAGTIQDLLAMQQAARVAGKPLLFGFQDMYDPMTLRLKRLILSNAIGTVERASVWAAWPRDAKYFGRNDWAGALKRGGEWIMDSPAMNALAHPINLLLYLMGHSETHTAEPITVESELYRANAIENFDTVIARASLNTGASILIALTHACRQTLGSFATIHGTSGRIDIDDKRVVVRKRDGTVLLDEERQDKYADMVHAVVNTVRGQPAPAAIADASTAAAHLRLVHGMSLASVVHEFTNTSVQVVTSSDGYPLRAIEGIEGVMKACAEQHKLAYELSSVPWSQRPGSVNVQNLERFEGPMATSNS